MLRKLFVMMGLSIAQIVLVYPGWQEVEQLNEYARNHQDEFQRLKPDGFDFLCVPGPLPIPYGMFRTYGRAFIDGFCAREVYNVSFYDYEVKTLLRGRVEVSSQWMRHRNSTSCDPIYYELNSSLYLETHSWKRYGENELAEKLAWSDSIYGYGCSCENYTGSMLTPVPEEMDGVCRVSQLGQNARGRQDDFCSSMHCPPVDGPQRPLYLKLLLALFVSGVFCVVVDFIELCRRICEVAGRPCRCLHAEDRLCPNCGCCRCDRSFLGGLKFFALIFSLLEIGLMAYGYVNVYYSRYSPCEFNLYKTCYSTRLGRTLEEQQISFLHALITLPALPVQLGLHIIFFLIDWSMTAGLR